jgi:hypothetical protein
MNDLGIYLYGVMRTGTEIPAGLSAIEDGIAVSTIPCGELAAIASTVPIDGFESTGTADPEWVVPRALRHERLIEQMVECGPILPVRFGSLFSTHDALRAWVTKNSEAIGRFLDHVTGKEEWTLKIQIEPAAAYDTLIAQDPAWAEKVRLLPHFRGTRYFQEKRLREQAREQVRQNAHRVTTLVRLAARGLADEKVLVPRGRLEADFEHVAHLAYLVPRNLAAAFLNQVRDAALDAACLRLTPSGPWPPAHFCPILETT